MSVEINLPPSLQPFANDARLTLVSGSTVAACLEELVGQFPQLRPRLFNGKRELLKSINIFVNGESVYPAARARPVRDGDKIHISYLVMGG
jgi:molybdopterin converting factor small subunit